MSTADNLKCSVIAACLLFTTPPSDRALEGWDGDVSALDEMEEPPWRLAGAGG